MYHRVGSARNAWEARYAIAPARFEAHMLALARHGMHPVPVDALSNWFENGTSLSTGAFVLTPSACRLIPKALVLTVLWREALWRRRFVFA